MCFERHCKRLGDRDHLPYHKLLLHDADWSGNATKQATDLLQKIVDKDNKKKFLKKKLGSKRRKKKQQSYRELIV